MNLPLWAIFMASAAWEIQQETTLEEQNNNVAELIEDQPKMAKIIEQTMKNYARECCKASLEKASNNAEASFNAIIGEPHVHKRSITDRDNIVLL